MNNLPDTPIKSDSDRQSGKEAWWNRPIWGEDSLLEDLVGKKKTLSDTAILLHTRAMIDVRVFGKMAQAIDSDKFINPEFLLFVRIKYYLARGIGEYEGLNQSVQLLQVAIEAKNTYFTLDQTELRYRSSKQQEFYNFVQELLELEYEKDQFRAKVREKLVEVVPEIKTEEGKAAMQAYAEELDKLAEHELGLKLLSLFKTYQLADYSILRVISDMVASLKESEVIDIKTLASLVAGKYDVFDKLGKIIGVPTHKNTVETYALMMHFILLNYRQALSYVKFDELISIMRQWVKPYRSLVGIRQEYPPKEYKLPKEFLEPIPGIEVYEKYLKTLTDSKTGHSYINFDED